jgi:ribonuclease P protein component
VQESSRKSLKFNQKYRLAIKSHIQSVFDQPSKFSYQFIQVLYRSNGLTHPRLAIMVNKSHYPKAVDRNRIRRIMRESFRHIADEMQPNDFIIIIKSGCPKDTKEIRKTADQLWKGVISYSKIVS